MMTLCAFLLALAIALVTWGALFAFFYEFTNGDDSWHIGMSIMISGTLAFPVGFIAFFALLKPTLHEEE